MSKLAVKVSSHSLPHLPTYSHPFPTVPSIDSLYESTKHSNSKKFNFKSDMKALQPPPHSPIPLHRFINGHTNCKMLRNIVSSQTWKPPNRQSPHSPPQPLPCMYAAYHVDQPNVKSQEIRFPVQSDMKAPNHLSPLPIYNPSTACTQHIIIYVNQPNVKHQEIGFPVEHESRNNKWTQTRIRDETSNAFLTQKNRRTTKKSRWNVRFYLQKLLIPSGSVLRHHYT